MLSKAGKERVLYTFCSRSGCADGGGPLAGLIQDTKGNFYGTTSGGGAYGGGVVFKLNTTGEETVLYSFCSQRGCDGVAPIAGVIRDRIGNLYGTTSGYQSNCQGSGCGVVFKLSKSGKEAALHSFTGGADGGEPFESGVIRDAAGNLYGTTLIGGASNIGVLFELSKGGKETVLYNFCSQSKCSDGASPNVGVIRDSKGNLYGTTYYGGDPACGESGVGCGVVFKLTP
jgi:uncharacterized repeat protein (TIGR03803 family)